MFAQEVLRGKQVHILVKTTYLLHVLYKRMSQRHIASKIGEKNTRND
jgi:hypothetical protein